MKRLVLSLILFFAYGLSLAAVSLTIDKSEVRLGQTFTLILSIEGSQVNTVPDLTALQKDFTVEGSESNVNYSIVNGRVHAASEWTLLLSAKRAGILAIPPLQVGNEKTAPMTIKVTDPIPAASSQSASPQNSTQPSSMQQQQQDVMLLTDISNTSPYVNQQIIYTVKLYNGSRLLDANYQPPQVEDALFVPMGNGRRYQLSENGRIYTVEEQQFALFPQKTGYLKIKPPVFNALIYDLSPKRISVEAKATVLNVKPIPSQYQGKSWLPAKQVVLSESYDKSTSSLPEGSTLVRTVTLQATAVPAQLLPALNFTSSDEFSVYPEKPIENNQFKQQDLVGTTTIKVTYLFNKEGKIAIPTLSLPWFNTVTGKEEVSSLPGFTINVVAETKKLSNPVKPINISKQTSTLAIKPVSPQSKTLRPVKPQTNLAWWFAIAFALAWLLTLIAWVCYKNNYNHQKQSKKQILKELQEACAKNKPGEARNALLKWGRLLWPKAVILNLYDLESFVDGSLKEQINQLTQVLYHDTNSRREWRGELLWQAFINFKPSLIKAKSDTPLPPLNKI